MSKSYKRIRREAYPDIGDQLAAIQSAIEAIAVKSNATLPDEFTAISERIEQVKADNPKPVRESGNVRD